VMWRRGFSRMVFARTKYKPAVKLEDVAVEPEGPSVAGPADGDGSDDDLAAVQAVADMPAEPWRTSLRAQWSPSKQRSAR